ncbi:hypothetical protein EV648_102144 [Kribbella sp. VKM Ac-2568]|nr:hypothetical protein EV648_102144 [Kribbella sp. VKM Ac-2568]
MHRTRLLPNPLPVPVAWREQLLHNRQEHLLHHRNALPDQSVLRVLGGSLGPVARLGWSRRVVGRAGLRCRWLLGG